jgi:hypothetical protein
MWLRVHRQGFPPQLMLPTRLDEDILVTQVLDYHTLQVTIITITI